MMRYFLLSFLCFLSLPLWAQQHDPVQWDFKAKKINAQTYELYYTAVLAAKWHIYAQDPGEGPVATEVVLKKNPLVQVSGKPKERGRLIKHFDKGFGRELKYYEDKLVLVQTVHLKTPVQTQIKGHVQYMVCDDARCLPPKKVAFVIDIR